MPMEHGKNGVKRCKMTRGIQLSISKQELLQLLEALSESNLPALAVKVNKAWLDESEARKAKRSKGDTQ